MNSNLYLKSELDARELILLESEVKNRGKSMFVAYILWYFLGIFGGHRFYLGQKGTAITMLVLTCTVIGLVVTVVWHLIDIYLTYKMVKEKNEQVESDLIAQILYNKRGQATPVL